jgi:hypothetical protein
MGRGAKQGAQDSPASPSATAMHQALLKRRYFMQTRRVTFAEPPVSRLPVVGRVLSPAGWLRGLVDEPPSSAALARPVRRALAFSAVVRPPLPVKRSHRVTPVNGALSIDAAETTVVSPAPLPAGMEAAAAWALVRADQAEIRTTAVGTTTQLTLRLQPSNGAKAAATTASRATDSTKGSRLMGTNLLETPLAGTRFV